MSEEVKNRSFRISDEVTEKFRQLCSNFDNQNTALNALINAYEVQNATAVLTDRQADISDYNTHLQALQAAFLRNLEFTENTEERIKQEFQRQLDSKNMTILDLQDRIKQTAQEKQSAEESEAAIKIEMITLSDKFTSQIDNLNTEMNSVKKALNTANEQITDKQSLINEYRTKLEKAEKDVTELPKLKEKTANAEKAKAEAEKESKQLREELNKQKLDFDNQIKALQDKANLEKEKAILEEKQKHIDEIKELYSECDKLRQTIAQLQTEKKPSRNRKSNKEE